MGLGAGEVLVLSKDLALEEACRAAVAETVDHFGRLDVLVNSAGILMAGSIESLSVSDYDRVMNINTRSALVLTQAAVPALLLSKGNIVHISRYSWAGHLGGSHGKPSWETNWIINY